MLQIRQSLQVLTAKRSQRSWSGCRGLAHDGCGDLGTIKLIEADAVGAVMKPQVAIQDFYPDDVAHCYGCGRLNSHGLNIRSVWDGDETVAVLAPREYHTAVPGYVYGGLISSLVDCHGTGSAALAAYRAAGREPGSSPPLRFVTASLKVDYLRPTPMGLALEARGRIKEVKPRKVVVDIEVIAGGEVCARGNVVAVLMPEHMTSAGSAKRSTPPGQYEPGSLVDS